MEPDPLSYLLSLEQFGIKLGLSNIEALTRALGFPQRRFRSVLVGGTNGKGSVAAMVDCALRQAGVRSARYTSPHLVNLEERFHIDGLAIERPTLAQAAGRIREIIRHLIASGVLDAPPTFFEATTAIALDVFSRAGVDAAVLEVGLGGRLDSTNIVDPVAAAIVSIDLDHRQHLGDTLEAIAAEKAGIVRRGIPVVIGPMSAGPREVIAGVCRDRGARLVEALEGSRADATFEQGQTRLALRTPLRSYRPVHLALRGEHQVANAIVAVRLLEHLQAHFAIGDEATCRGLEQVQWPGRLQLLTLHGGRQLLLDAAHNPAGATALAAHVAKRYGRLPFVFGAMRDKEVVPMLEALAPVASHFIMTAPSTPRAFDPVDLAALARQHLPALDIEAEARLDAALERAWRHGPLACVAGSIFLLGDVLRSVQ